MNVRKGTYYLFQLMLQMAIFVLLSLSLPFEDEIEQDSRVTTCILLIKKKKGLKAATGSRDKHNFVTNKVAFKKGSFPILIAQISPKNTN